MNATGCAPIPHELCYWITFLTKALPPRSIGTFIELLIGAMLTPAGFVTESYLLLDMQRHWSTYYKWLEEGKWSWLKLARQFVCLLLQVRDDDVIHLAIDDTLSLRASKKAPGSVIHHQHGNKPNLASYVRGQCWVSLAAVFHRTEKETTAIPLLMRLIPSAGNTGKLVAANVIMRAGSSLFEGRTVRVLVDCWYMRKRFIAQMNEYGFSVIGQARIDTRLYDEPLAKEVGQRGRPRKYGEKYTPKRIAHLRKTDATLTLYGKEQRVRYRTRIVKARFLDGQLVRAVWCELDKGKAQWSKTRLFLSTDTSLSAERVLESYGMRWSIESMFYQLKELWGMGQAWQQRRQTLHRWIHLMTIGYGLLHMLTLALGENAAPLLKYAPWRVQNPTTAGRIRLGLIKHFRYVNVRSWWNQKRKKFEAPGAQNYVRDG